MSSEGKGKISTNSPKQRKEKAREPFQKKREGKSSNQNQPNQGRHVENKRNDICFPLYEKKGQKGSGAGAKGGGD